MPKRTTEPDERRPRRRRGRWLMLAGAAILPEIGALRRRGYGFGGNVIVRCRQGHLFTTIWIPGGSLKALRFGPWRLQRCPVGPHWSLVAPVRASELTEEQRLAAREVRDLRVP